MMRKIVLLSLSLGLLLGCSGGGGEALTEQEKKDFRGTKPSDEVLKNLGPKDPPPVPSGAKGN